MTDIDVTRRNKKPRLLLESERARLEEFIDSIGYSARYSDSEFEYRHVQLPKAMLKVIPRDYFDDSKGTLKLLWEEEWRGLGITQSLGWEHYEVHEPEPHILLFNLLLIDLGTISPESLLRLAQHWEGVFSGNTGTGFKCAFSERAYYQFVYVLMNGSRDGQRI
ncbi:cyclin-dependent kinase regulatory subunit [Cladophialophora bantiana CBS 173.52]|uniref:Cyclin-dependent kinases regulatory subunit n=1 Tax=Cladophialophora bantiana (strain ATCC 10958 / CBS 173.52 / CDC B-1940 / NIH 8579) TaxID=1442370 RepID=A0A0D2ILE6_CLAB1|nr:cyclin-dependent kinase regulatory subunit [Cladophialophora bantiana CBS 173.52]KIW97619.1 cyclin-dependent kinase regulatory subunit [Cladophialophora bantiana CBS 173.52]